MALQGGVVVLVEVPLLLTAAPDTTGIVCCACLRCLGVLNFEAMCLNSSRTLRTPALLGRHTKLPLPRGTAKGKLYHRARLFLQLMLLAQRFEVQGS